MGHYDLRVADAKQYATRSLLNAETSKDLTDMAHALDELNKAWDELTNCLVRQREERDRLISELLSELAEAKKNR